MIPPKDQISHGSDDNLRLIILEGARWAAWYLEKAGDYAEAQHDSLCQENLRCAARSFKQVLHANKLLTDSKAARAAKALDLQNGS